MLYVTTVKLNYHNNFWMFMNHESTYLPGSCHNAGGFLLSSAQNHNVQMKQW